MKTDQFLQAELPLINSVLLKEISAKSSEHLHFNYPSINLSELLNHLTCEKIFYFKSKYNGLTFLGLGESLKLKSSELFEFLSKNPGLFVIASFLFEENPSDAEFILPEWIFINRNNSTELIISKSGQYKDYSLSNLFFNTQFDLYHYDPIIAPWIAYEEHPEHDQWKSIIETCDQLFDQRELDKIVMSRKKLFSYNEPIDAIAFFKALLEKNNNAASSYAIFYQKTFDEAFVSITPEKLFSIEGNQFESISLAASAPRGSSEVEDLEFEELLKNSDKLIREHNLVTEEIVKKLRPLASVVEVSPMITMKLPYIQHRSAIIKALLLEHTNPLSLVELLHPTPAVGGLPWDKAKSKIAQLEPYKRDLYAAPIGIMSAHFSELAVGIRSALIEGSKLTLFGGAGIVKGSNPEEEWLETATKMNPFLKVINHE